MVQKAVNNYEKLFLVEGYKAFSQAVNYLLKMKKAKTLSEVARKLGISASTLTMYMSGEKHVSKNALEKMKVVFGVDVKNPLTYEDTSWMNTYLEAGYAPVPAGTHLKVYFSMRKVINEQQKIIENLRKQNESLKKINVELYDSILQNESVLLEAQLTRQFSKHITQI